MIMIGEITLDKVSPFKLSERQKSALADFMSEPWPEEGDVATVTCNDLMKEFESSFLLKPVSVDMACGFMTIIGAWSGSVQVKLSKLLSKRTSNVMDLQPNWESPTSVTKFRESDRRALELRDDIIKKLSDLYTSHPEEALTPGMVNPSHAEILCSTFEKAYKASALQWVKVTEVDASTGTKSGTEARSSRDLSSNSLSLFGKKLSIPCTKSSIQEKMMKSLRDVQHAFDSGPRLAARGNDRDARLALARLRMTAEIQSARDVLTQTSGVDDRSAKSDEERRTHIEPSSSHRSAEEPQQNLPLLFDDVTEARQSFEASTPAKVDSWSSNTIVWQ
jgi:hypothetical protein